MKFPSPQALEEGNVSELNRLMEEAQVKNYLANNPNFLIDNPQLLTHIELNHDCEQATSLVERQIKVLRERNQVMQGQLIEMLQAAHNNENLLVQCNCFMLHLLTTNSLDELCKKTIELLKKDFNLNGASLVLIGDYAETNYAKILNNASEIKALLNCQFPDSQPLCGRLESSHKKALFGDFSRDLESFCLIPLGKECEKGLLALASNDVSRFAPEMGTLFVQLIAKLVAHLAKQYEQK